MTEAFTDKRDTQTYYSDSIRDHRLVDSISATEPKTDPGQQHCPEFPAPSIPYLQMMLSKSLLPIPSIRTNIKNKLRLKKADGQSKSSNARSSI